MQITLAAIADAANVTKDDKLNLLGTYDTVQAGSLPAAAPNMVLAVTMRFEYEDKGRRSALRYELIDEDGGVRLEGGVNLSTGEVLPGHFSHLHLIRPLHPGLVFERWGRYRLVLKLDGEPQPADVVFQVTPLPD
jgi:hypothetical protein